MLVSLPHWWAQLCLGNLFFPGFQHRKGRRGLHPCSSSLSAEEVLRYPQPTAPGLSLGGMLLICSCS